MKQKKYEVDKSILLFDFLLLSDGIFDAEIVMQNQTLLMKFGNGQEFILSCKRSRRRTDRKRRERFCCF